jgi:hypothetical protein
MNLQNLQQLPLRCLPRATGQQAEAVEADEDGEAFVAEDTQRQWQSGEQVDQQQGGGRSGSAPA